MTNVKYEYMALVNIREKCITIARNEARRNSSAIYGGRSIFIKRCYGTYRLMAMDVTAVQRVCRTLFAEAQKRASEDMKHWEKRRYWSRQAKVHNVKGARRMAVSYYYRLLKRGQLGVGNCGSCDGDCYRSVGYEVPVVVDLNLRREVDGIEFYYTAEKRLVA